MTNFEKYKQELTVESLLSGLKKCCDCSMCPARRYCDSLACKGLVVPCDGIIQQWAEAEA